MARVDATTRESKKQWHSPKLRELGNLKDFVKSGVAGGKSGLHVDGESMAGNETMD